MDFIGALVLPWTNFILLAANFSPVPPKATEPDPEPTIVGLCEESPRPVFLRSRIWATAASLGSLIDVAADVLADVRSLLEGRTFLVDYGRTFMAEPVVFDLIAGCCTSSMSFDRSRITYCNVK